MKKTISMATTILIGLLLTSTVAVGQARNGQPAPDFTLAAADGTEHRLSEYRGKLVVLEWVNFDCPFVRKHYGSGNMPALQQAAIANGAVWLSVSSSAPGKQGHFAGKTLNERLAKERWSATAYLLDEDGTVGRAYGARATPHMYVIDPDGVLRYQGAIDSIRSANPADIEKATNYVTVAIDALLDGGTIETAVSEPYGCSVKY